MLWPSLNVFPIISGVFYEKRKKVFIFHVKGSSNYHAIPFSNALKVTGGLEKNLSRIHHLTHLLCKNMGYILIYGLCFFLFDFASFFYLKYYLVLNLEKDLCFVELKCPPVTIAL